MRELRHDFRHYYHVSYDDVDVNEAIDLVQLLPWGSTFRAAKDPRARWNESQYQAANILDALIAIHWRLMGSPSQYMPEPTERPGDFENRIKAAQKAKETRRKIEDTKWEEA